VKEFEVGDEVTMENVWKYPTANGEIDKITTDYVVVKWHGIPGFWHYTMEQAERMEIINEK